MKIIGHIKSDFTDKFGIPRQSGMVEGLLQVIEFEGIYRSADAVRGIEGFSHIWLIWQFSRSMREGEKLTVRPPRLGGNKRMGVFATRSPYRPNPIGLSCVKLEGVEYDEKGSPRLLISGADLLDGTPIYDIKPYLPFADCKRDAVGGFADEFEGYCLEVLESPLTDIMPEDKRLALYKLLSLDPRPSYIEDDEREYGLDFAGYNVKFRVEGTRLRITELKLMK